MTPHTPAAPPTMRPVFEDRRLAFAAILTTFAIGLCVGVAVTASSGELAVEPARVAADPLVVDVARAKARGRAESFPDGSITCTDGGSSSGVALMGPCTYSYRVDCNTCTSPAWRVDGGWAVGSSSICTAVACVDVGRFIVPDVPPPGAGGAP